MNYKFLTGRKPVKLTWLKVKNNILISGGYMALNLGGLTGLLGGLTGIVSGVIGTVAGAIGAVSGVVGGIADTVTSVVDGILDKIGDVTGGITDPVTDVVDGVTSGNLSTDDLIAVLNNSADVAQDGVTQAAVEISGVAHTAVDAVA
ncbi:hypothetical protein [Serratia sp. AKBS12]|uniref:hypothetical protein n=1 Tax=Serratia sp. AKBS12 TaxID=2974597 RepID=UPI00216540AA|nr:hypothetical protein [Serratia sp. AKBS12]MCS3409091.1 hypothetical protein [Serratia sp. AKBS12]